MPDTHHTPGRSLFVLAVAAAVSLAPSRGRAAEATSEKSPFVAEVKRNWRAWDVNHDGTLSPEEINPLVLNPAIKGDAAAAAGALKLAIRSKKLVVPALTLAYFDAYAAKARAPKINDADAAAATVDVDNRGVPASTPGTAPKWDTMFGAAKHRIASSKAGVNKGLPSDLTGDQILGQIKQGSLGDCFFVAVVGAYVHRNPGDVRKLITPQSDGKTRVTFGNKAEPFTISPLTDAQRAISSGAGEQGNLLVTLEQAYGRYRQRARGPATRPTDTSLDGTDAICNGGSAAPVIFALTGHDSTYVRPPRGDLTKRLAAADEILPKMRVALEAGVRDHRLIAASVPDVPTSTARPADASTDARSTDKSVDTGDPANETASVSLSSPPNITHKHVYAVLDYDARTDRVTLWNPHGQAFKPKGPDGLANGYTTNHGVFEIPLVEAYQFIGGLCFEQDHTPEPRKKA